MERLPGEDGQAAFKRWLANLVAREENYDPKIVKRLARTLGTAADPLLANGLGANIGGMFEAELQHYREHEWATTSDDVLWRRSKMGLHIGAAGRAEVARWFGEAVGPVEEDAPVGHRFATPGS
jgi:glycerol-3-phosphate dehydrogenase